MICNLSVSPGCIWRAEDNSMQDPGLPTLFFPFLPFLFFYFLSLTLLIIIFLKPKGGTGTKGGERGTEPKGGGKGDRA